MENMFLCKFGGVEFYYVMKTYGDQLHALVSLLPLRNSAIPFG